MNVPNVGLQGPLLRVEPIVLPLPDFDLVKIDQFAANKTDYKKFPKTNLLKHISERFHAQPPWPTVHEALTFFRDDAYRLLKKVPAKVLVTDAAFHEHAFQAAVELDHLRRFWTRLLHERGVAKAVAEELVQKELDRLRERIIITKELMFWREKKHLYHRFTTMEKFAKAREHRWNVHLEWEETQKWLENRGLKRLEAYREKGQYNLYSICDPSLVIRLPGQGKPLEEILGDIHHQKILAILENNHKWRFDTSFTTLPNGGMTEIQNGAGKSKEHIEAKIAIPAKDKRTESFQIWHDSQFKIESPNHVVITAPQSQGHIPQKIEATIHDRITAQRTQDHQEYHQSGLLIRLPNASMTHSASNGKPPEEVAADLYWPKRDLNQEKTKQWKGENLYTRQGEKGFVSLPGVGKSLENILGNIGQSNQEKTQKLQLEAYNDSFFTKTSNGGIGRLPQSGDPHEEVSGEQGNHMAHQRSFNHQVWLGTGKNAAPSSQGPARLDHVDQTPGVLKKRSHLQKAKQDLKHDNDLSGTHSNHNNLRSSAPSIDSVDSKDKDVSLTREIDQAEKALKNVDEHRVDLSAKNKVEVNENTRSTSIPRHKAIKAFQKSMENEGASSTSRLQAHAHIIHSNSPELSQLKQQEPSGLKNKK